MLLFASEISKFSKLQDICDASRLTGFGHNMIRENCEEVSDTLSFSYTGLVVFALPLTAGFLLLIGGILDYRKYQKLNRKLEEQQVVLYKEFISLYLKLWVRIRRGKLIVCFHSWIIEDYRIICTYFLK